MIKCKLPLLILCVIMISLSGCGLYDKPDSTPEPKQEIVFAIQKDYTGVYADIAQKFSEQSPATNIKLIELAEGGVEYHRMLSSVITGKEVRVDICMVEDIWMDEFIKGGYIKPIDLPQETELEDYPAGIRSSVAKSGKVYAVPYELDVGVMYYRNDVYIADSVPTYGSVSECVIDQSDGEDRVCRVLELSNYTGSISEGLRLYKRLLNSNHNMNFSDFKNGNAYAAMSSTVSFREILNGFSKVAGKVSVTEVSDEANMAPLARLYSVAVSNSTLYDDNVKEFMDYLCRESTHSALLRARGTVPVKYAQFEDPMILDSSVTNKDLVNHIDDIRFRVQRSDYTLASLKAQEALVRYLEDDNEYENAVEAFEALQIPAK